MVGPPLFARLCRYANPKVGDDKDPERKDTELSKVKTEWDTSIGKELWITDEIEGIS